jgi:hypothetical protein
MFYFRQHMTVFCTLHNAFAILNGKVSNDRFLTAGSSLNHSIIAYLTIGFNDAFTLVVPPFLLQFLQVFALKHLQYGDVDAAPASHARDAPS